MNKNQSFVSMKPKEGRRLEITWAFQIRHKEKTELGKTACFVPGFNIFYSANSVEDAVKKGKALTEMFFNHFLSKGKDKIKLLALELHKLGFKAENDAITMKKIINKEVVSAKFKPVNTPLIPIEFSEAESIENEAEMEISQ